MSPVARRARSGRRAAYCVAAGLFAVGALAHAQAPANVPAASTPSASAPSASTPAAPLPALPDAFVDGFAARVGARVLTVQEVVLETHVVLILRYNVAAAQTPVRGTVYEKAVEASITAALLDEMARDRGLSLAEDELAKAAARFELRFANPAAYQTFLREHGASDEEVRRVLRRRLRTEVLLRQLVAAAETPEVAKQAVDDALARQRGLTPTFKRRGRQPASPPTARVAPGEAQAPATP